MKTDNQRLNDFKDRLEELKKRFKRCKPEELPDVRAAMLEAERDYRRFKQHMKMPISAEAKASLAAKAALKLAEQRKFERKTRKIKRLPYETKHARRNVAVELPEPVVANKFCDAPMLHSADLCSCTKEILPETTFEEVRERSNRILATKYLDHFVRQAWPLIDNSTPLEWGPHVDAICFHVQNQLMDRWQSKRTKRAMRAQNMLINVPPRSLKTTILSFATVWAWLHEPSMKIMYLSSNPRVSVTSARWAHTLVHSEWYQKLVDGAWKLKPDHDSLTSYGNVLGGTRNARGLAGTVTGEGCIARGVMVATRGGDVPIELLQVGDLVWSKNLKTNKLELKPVTAVRKTGHSPILTVKTLTGNVLRCTDDHPVWTRERSYRRADETDNATVSVLQYTNPAEQSGQTAPLHEMQNHHPYMLDMWEHVQTRSGGARQTTSQGKKHACLLPQMLGVASENRQEVLRPASPSGDCSQQGLSVLQGFVSNKTQQPSVLLDEMQGRTSQLPNARPNEFELSSRINQSAQSRFVGTDQAADQRTRWVSMYSLPTHAGPACASHRSQSDTESSTELNNALLRVSQHAPQELQSTVSAIYNFLVDGRRETDDVFDITVEGNHNFFAGGVLVHNCDWMIIDDPHDVRDSEVEIKTTVEGYDAAVHNRINDPKLSIRTSIMQRFRTDDFSGHVLEKHTGNPAKGGWLHVRMPTEFEPPGTAGLCDCGSCVGKNVFGWKDWREVEGEVLHKRFTPEYLAEELRTKGPYGYAGQHQQRPAPATGGMLKNSWYGWFRLPEDPPIGAWTRPQGCSSIATVEVKRRKNGKLDFDMIVISVDGTFGNTKESSGSAVGLQVYGLRKMEKYLLDDKTAPIPYLDALAVIRGFVKDWAHEAPMRILVEPKAFGPMAVEELRRDIRDGKLKDKFGKSVVVVVEVLRGPDDKGMAGDKITRAHAATPTLAAGLVLLREGKEWAHAHVRETGVFPNGKRDDRVDCMTQIINFYGESTDIAKAKALLRR